MSRPLEVLARELAESGVVSAEDMAALCSTVTYVSAQTQVEGFVRQVVEGGPFSFDAA
jgi:hypothetical protein